MIFLNCDYNEGAHERILEKLMETNMEQTIGYGEDDYCRQAAELILEKCQMPQAMVQFLVGGTQTNLTVISAALKPYQGVISADTGHINCHETGAIEATGHKVLVLPGRNGKIKGDQIREMAKAHWEDVCFEHMVQPGMVYISNPTEIGTIYHKRSLEDLYAACKEYGLYLYIDGARLGYGLTARDNDLTLPFIASHCDAFTIGGTKQGALFGEAVVITNPVLAKDFRYMVKQKGGMLAKGRLLGIQFLELMRDDLYFELSAHADNLAMKIRSVLIERGICGPIPSTTNQQFAVFTDQELGRLSEKYSFSYWNRVDESHSMVRICTSWATREEDVDQLLKDLKPRKNTVV